MLRLRVTCDAIANGFLPVESMARFYTSQSPYDHEQVDSAFSRSEPAWPQLTCGMDELR
jgi:hypothetical protein